MIPLLVYPDAAAFGCMLPENKTCEPVKYDVVTGKRMEIAGGIR